MPSQAPSTSSGQTEWSLQLHNPHNAPRRRRKAAPISMFTIGNKPSYLNYSQICDCVARCGLPLTDSYRCCASGYSCSMLSNGVVGCCPSGSQCGGTVNAAQITTVTVTQYLTTTQYPQTPSTVVQVGSKTTTVLPGIYVTTSTTNPSIAYNGYCSTLIAHGPDLPTTAQGVCGPILVINRADVRSMGWKLPVLITAFHGALGLYSRFGFRW
jgi:hypothetical protein